MPELTILKVGIEPRDTLRQRTHQFIRRIRLKLGGGHAREADGQNKNEATHVKLS